MKILQIAPYVTIDAKPDLTRNKTGFGYMVYDIAAGLAKNNEVEMLLLHCQYDEFYSDNIRFLENNKYKTLRGLFRPILLLKLFALICKYPMSFGGLVREIYLWLLMGYLDGIIKNGGYDVVHIHGCNYIDLAIIDICKKNGVKFVVTLHGLNSFDASVKMDASGKRFAKDFLRLAFEHNWTLTFISSGMKRRVMEYLKVDKADNIHVVCNSFRLEAVRPVNVNIRELYGIPSDCKIILYVGNQSENKNQKQLVRAFCRLNERLQRHTYILFIGRINEDYNLNEEIRKLALGSHLIMCGVIPKAQMHSYYEQADGTALFSISEGFGLSLIEGMSYGKPSLAIKTMDAFDDIYSPDAMIGVETHDDKLIADRMLELLTREWDANIIKQHASKFSNNQMIHNYEYVFNL